jgi:hypothetical protein
MTHQDGWQQRLLKPFFHLLMRFPINRRSENELMDAIREIFIEKWYLILYQIKDQTVYVDYIVDCRQDYGWLVK